ncbi:MAG: tRNA (adenosine(37)-N6)-threonylcarbamoyltransferase complex dimerization subunit type 1 TsaB [Desulfosalsimonas sp.]
MNLLAVDTSGACCSAAVMKDGVFAAEISAQLGRSHARHVMDLVSLVLQASGSETADIDAYGVTEGPGSFTGLRIGMATVKGLAFARGRPAAGVSTLYALARPLRWFAGLVCPVLDARKTEVYAEIYRFSGQGHSVESPAAAWSPESLAEQVRRLGEPCLFAGTGAELYRGVISSALGELASFASPELSRISARSVAEAAAEKIADGCHKSAAELVPVYLRKSDAERKRSA